MKIATTSTFERAQSLVVGKSKDPREIQESLDAVARALDQSEGGCESLRRAYEDKLVFGSPSDVAAIEKEMAAAKRERDGLKAIKPLLETLLKSAMAEGRAAKIAELRVDAEQQNARAQKALLECPGLFSKLANIFQEITKADAATRRYNEFAPDADSLADAELAARGFIGRPYQVLSDKTVDLWCEGASWSAVPDERQGEVTTSDGRTGTIGGFGRNISIPVVLRQFRRLEYVQADEISCESLVYLRLPGLKYGDPDFWSPPQGAYDPVELLRINDANRGAAPTPLPERKVHVELQPIHPNLRNDPTEVPQNIASRGIDHSAAA